MDIKWAKREICISNPRLIKIRNNLRNLFFHFYEEKKSKLLDKMDFANMDDKTIGHFLEKRRIFERIYHNSIISCAHCGNRTGDRIYLPKKDRWYCHWCYREIIEPNSIKKEQLFRELELERSQISSYLEQLGSCYTDNLGNPLDKRDVFAEMDIATKAEFFSNLGSFAEIGPFPYSRIILSKMGIPRWQQDIFLELLELYGCFGDAEIFLNDPEEILAYFYRK